MSKTKPKTKPAKAKSAYPPILRNNQLAAAYGVNAQAISYLCKSQSLELDDLLDPSSLYTLLLKRGNRSPFRDRLSDPAEIVQISRRLIEMMEEQNPSRSLTAAAKFVATGKAPKDHGSRSFLLDVFRAAMLAALEADIAADAAENSPA